MGLAALVALIWGLCFVLIQASLPSPAPLLLAASRAIIGGGVLAAWIAGRRWWSIQHPSDRSQPRSTPLRSVLPSVPVLVVLAATNAAIALGAMYLAAGRAEATVASILAGTQPVILAAAGWAVFGERPSGRTTVGLGVAMVGLVLVAVMSSGAASSEGIALAVFASVAPSAGTVLMRQVGPSVDLLVTTSAQFIVGGVMLLAVSAAVEPWGRWRGLPPQRSHSLFSACSVQALRTCSGSSSSTGSPSHSSAWPCSSFPWSASSRVLRQVIGPRSPFSPALGPYSSGLD